MASVHEQIVDNQNLNSITKLTQDRVYGKQTSNSVGSQDFLQLLIMQLQYQDPMNPMDNSEMLAQEAQFSTLEQMESLGSSFTKFSNAYQANSLLGQNVEITVDGKTTTGKVDYVDLTDAKGASVNVAGKNYPLNAVTKVYPADVKETNSSDISTDEKNFLLTALDYIADNVGNIANAVFKNPQQNITTDNN